ncbi:MAG: hypothetical protein ABGY41_21020, partial [Candidatus Poribacteria bacterium]
AWNAMSVKQADDGINARCWGLLAGYDESEETYTVRHQHGPGGGEPFTVRYDAIGHYDGWFCVLVYGEPAPVDAINTHIKALRNAVAFADGTRVDPHEVHSRDYRVDAHGFAAYKLWRDALQSETALAKWSRSPAYCLGKSREHAAAYLRELVDVFPDAASDLEAAAAHYTPESEALDRLHDLCRKADEAGGFSADTRAEARDLVTAALQADRDAIGRIQAALEVLEESE